MALLNKQIVLIQRPSGAVKDTDFKLVEIPLPNLKEGEVLLKTIYFSLDPYMRNRLNETKSYIAPIELGHVISGGAVCQVEASKNAAYKTGDLVTTFTGWQEYAIVSPEEGADQRSVQQQATKIPGDVKPSLFLGALSMPGLAAYHGLFDIGQPKKGETVVVSAATGAVGSLVGQFAKLEGCRVVGIAGGSEKCNFAINELGYDACVDHKSKTFAEDLKQACPSGVDIYFENVGGPILMAVWPLLNEHARIPVCGAIYWYNDAATLLEPNHGISQILSRASAFNHMMLHLDRLPIIWLGMIRRRIKVQGYVTSDHFGDLPKFREYVLPLVKSGQLKYKEDFVKGIENAPQAFAGLFKGKNFGKLIVEV